MRLEKVSASTQVTMYMYRIFQKMLNHLETKLRDWANRLAWDRIVLK